MSGVDDGKFCLLKFSEVGTSINKYDDIADIN